MHRMAISGPDDTHSKKAGNGTKDKDDGEADDDDDEYAHGKYVWCRVFGRMGTDIGTFEVSLRSSRVDGDLDDDDKPEKDSLVKGFVVETTNKGCFVRVSRTVHVRVFLKELADSFLPAPAKVFPPGRLVVGKVKKVQPQSKKRITFVDLDLRESTLLKDSGESLGFADIKLGDKLRGTVTWVEDFGVFVRLEGSDVTGMVHKSEVSDKFVKNPKGLFDPGDLVKVLVVKKSNENKRIGFSMKASHFEDDSDSDDDSDILDDDDDDDEEMEDAVVSDDDDDDDERMEEDDLDSDDEDFVSKLAARELSKRSKKSNDNDDDSDDSDSDDSDSDDDSDDSDSDDEKKGAPKKGGMDTNVGFSWEAGDAATTSTKSTKDDSDDDDDDDDDSSDEGDGSAPRKSHSSKKKAAARRREESEISERERALADGTADENPETAADFERLLAGDPNRSEHWIRYMAYYLSLADTESARRVANRAFERIDFRKETEKLNVWTALLTMELKFGNAFEATMDRACQHNNPKQVYLRVCEMLVKEAKNSGGSPEAVQRADTMFNKMCKKFRSKKTVWISHLTYLVEQDRSQEAHQLLKRALKSLPEYKHVETMSKFAQLEFEHGSLERGRTIFDGILAKHPKRLDLLFVYVDKEVKAGEVGAARAVLENVCKVQVGTDGRDATAATTKQKKKLTDKQMKSLFKKWYRMEEEHGTEESQDHVKNAAREYVEKSS